MDESMDGLLESMTMFDRVIGVELAEFSLHGYWVRVLVGTGTIHRGRSGPNGRRIGVYAEVFETSDKQNLVESVRRYVMDRNLAKTSRLGISDMFRSENSSKSAESVEDMFVLCVGNVCDEVGVSVAEETLCAEFESLGWALIEEGAFAGIDKDLPERVLWDALKRREYDPSRYNLMGVGEFSCQVFRDGRWRDSEE